MGVEPTYNKILVDLIKQDRWSYTEFCMLNTINRVLAALPLCVYDSCFGYRGKRRESIFETTEAHLELLELVYRQALLFNEALPHSNKNAPEK